MTIADIPILKVIEPPVGDKVDTVIEKLISQKASKPRTLKTLGSTTKAHFANQLDSDDVQVLVGKLTQRGFIRVSKGKVSYKFTFKKGYRTIAEKINSHFLPVSLLLLVTLQLG